MTIFKVWNPGGKRRRTKRGRRRRNGFLTLNPRGRRRTRLRRSRRNPTGIPYSGAVLRPRRCSGSRPRYTRLAPGLSRWAFARLGKRGRGLGALARALAPRGGKRKLLKLWRRQRRRTSAARRRTRRCAR